MPHSNKQKYLSTLSKGDIGRAKAVGFKDIKIGDGPMTDLITQLFCRINGLPDPSVSPGA
jgi:hypothetical protein